MLRPYPITGLTPVGASAPPLPDRPLVEPRPPDVRGPGASGPVARHRRHRPGSLERPHAREPRGTRDAERARVRTAHPGLHDAPPGELSALCTTARCAGRVVRQRTGPEPADRGSGTPPLP